MMRTIYNTTFIVNEEIESEWIAFIREHYVVPLKRDGMTSDTIFTKVSIDHSEGKTYSLQLVFDSAEKLGRFMDEHLPGIEEKIVGKYGNRYLCFSSFLYEI